MTILWALLFVLSLLAFWFTNLLGLPGNWLIVAAAGLYAWLLPGDSRAALGWPVVGAVAALALVGELIEFIAGAAGVRKAGGSRLSAFLALFGSLVGAIIGVFVGLPIPFVGSLVAAVLFAGAGAAAGAALGENLAGRSNDASWKVGQAAFWGRLWGTLAKTLIGAMMVGVTVAAMCF